MSARKNRTTDLAADLERINSKGILTNTIKAAKDGFFHQWKSPSKDPTGECMYMLRLYPKTYELAEAVSRGEYRDEPDYSDCIRMRNGMEEKYWGHFGITDETLAIRFPTSIENEIKKRTT